MLYREAGQFKVTYAKDQQIFPIRQDRGAAIRGERRPDERRDLVGGPPDRRRLLPGAGERHQRVGHRDHLLELVRRRAGEAA